MSIQLMKSRMVNCSGNTADEMLFRYLGVLFFTGNIYEVK